MKLFLILSYCALVINCFANPITPKLFFDTRIVGGKEVNIFNHPHQISLHWKSIFYPESSYVHICGGSIIYENIILTAAHCTVANVPSQLKIVAGSSFIDGTDGIIAPVQEIIIHDKFNYSTMANDVSLLILSIPLPINNFTIKTIELAENEPKEGSISTITGWGTTSEGGYSGSTVLQEVKVPIVSNEVCNKDYKGLILDSMLCAGYRDGGKDACQGDSGGPLLVEGKLAGIVSWGYGCAQPNYPGVNAKVSYLRSWILEKVDKYIN